MEKLLYFDYAAIAIMLIMLAAIICRRHFYGKVNKSFLFLLLVAILTAAFDIFAVALDNAGEGHRLLKYITHDVYLISRNLSIAVFDFFLVALTDTRHKVSQNTLLKLTMPLPFFVVLFTVIASNHTGWIYYLDAHDTYTRGSLFWILYVAVFVYGFYSFIYTVKYTKYLGKMKILSLFTIYPFIVGSTAIQAFYPHLLLEQLAMALGLLFIMLMVQRPEQRIDSITGLYKMAAYEEDIKQAYRNKKTMNVIMVTIANYRTLLDVLGYEGFHMEMRKISSNFLAMNRKNKLGAEMYYIGNGRYRIVIDQYHFDNTKEIAELINYEVNNGHSDNGIDVGIQAYVCVVKCPEDIDDFETIMEFGRRLEKSEFTANVIYASELLKSRGYNIIKEIDVIVEDALVNNKFEVYYQPIYSVKDEKFTSAEALLRLKSDDYGFVSPEIFIPAAEKSGAIHRIGGFVFEEVCKFISSDEYKKLGVEYIEVNLSVIQCMQKGLAHEILQIMEKYDVTPEQINLEITETATTYSQKVMTENINELTGAGIHFSLDDFGTGYSNMKRIASLPLSIIKFDKSFTDINSSPKMEIILKNMIKMVKDMNMKIVVEGIETEQLVRHFSDLECEYIQGYYYSKPIPKTEFVKFINAQKAS
ncbi:MAG: EAL domain-containing protein [Clostridium sp.]|nr:EAL domain-containing protein [Clostridium sp.]